MITFVKTFLHFIILNVIKVFSLNASNFVMCYLASRFFYITIKAYHRCVRKKFKYTTTTIYDLSEFLLLLKSHSINGAALVAQDRLESMRRRLLSVALAVFWCHTTIILH